MSSKFITTRHTKNFKSKNAWRKKTAINCQICFENVSNPCVCSNLHPFCSDCLDTRLQTDQDCPTCHVPIKEKNQIIGSDENKEHQDFSDPSARKESLMKLFNFYESELENRSQSTVKVDTVPKVNEKYKKNSVRTMKVTCQICFEHVTNPCVCSNLHPFCSDCLGFWLKKEKNCPTCRVSITKKNYIDTRDEEKIRNGCDKSSHLENRKARFLKVFDSYEAELNRGEVRVTELESTVQNLEMKLKFCSETLGPNLDRLSALNDQLRLNNEFVKTELTQKNNAMKHMQETHENQMNEANRLASENNDSLSAATKQIGRLKVAIDQERNISYYFDTLNHELAKSNEKLQSDMKRLSALNKQLIQKCHIFQNEPKTTTDSFQKKLYDLESRDRDAQQEISTLKSKLTLLTQTIDDLNGHQQKNSVNDEVKRLTELLMKKDFQLKAAFSQSRLDQGYLSEELFEKVISLEAELEYTKNTEVADLNEKNELLVKKIAFLEENLDGNKMDQNKVEKEIARVLDLFNDFCDYSTFNKK